VLFNSFFVYRTLNTNKIKYKNFRHEVGRSWISEVQNQSESSYDDLQMPQEQTAPSWPKQDLPGRLSGGISGYTNMKKYLLVGKGKRSILQESVKCMSHIRSEVKPHTFVNSTLFPFTRVLF
jgi:hypothetical protein